MKTLHTFYLYLILSTTAQAAGFLDINTSLTPKIQEILNNASIEDSKVSAGLGSTAVLYVSNKTLEEGLMPEEVLKITTDAETLWLQPTDWVNYINFEFIDDRRLILARATAYMTDTILIDTTSKQITWIGSGKYQLMDDNLIKLIGQKYYLDRAIWLNALADYDGNIIEFLSAKPNGKCVTLKSFLNQKNKYPKLKQSLDDCIYINES
jgi:hypothetical protein